MAMEKEITVNNLISFGTRFNEWGSRPENKEAYELAMEKITAIANRRFKERLRYLELTKMLKTDEES